MIDQDEDRLDELPEADIAYDGPVHDTNAQAKRRQTIIWGLLSSVCGVALLWAGYTIIFKSDEPVKTDKAAGERLLATADVVRANDMSPETRASELTVRVQQLDQQIGSLNQGLTSKDAEVQTLTRQLEAERADALRTIDAIQRQSGTRGESGGVPSGGSSQAAGALGGGAAGLQMPGGAPNQTGGFVAGAPQMGPGMDGGAQQPRRTMTTVRVGQGAGGAGGGRNGSQEGPSVARAGGGPGAASSGGGNPSFMTASGQVFDSENFVPPNAYVSAKVLVGVDVATGVTASADPKPVLFRLTGPAVHVGRNGEFQTTDLTGCLVNGAAYGELSSEKVYIRLQRISCPVGSRQFSVSTVEGYATHAGKAGVRGPVVSREGGLTGRALVAGTLQGLGNSIQQYTNQANRLIGVGSGGNLQSSPNLDAGQMGASAAAAGVGNAASMLSEYYIQRAEQYQPVIEMPTGIQVELVFLSGFEVRPRS